MKHLIRRLQKAKDRQRMLDRLDRELRRRVHS